MPLVTVIVRSMGRPLLASALQSIARQDHPDIDVVVVDATGGAHPPLPTIGWRKGHSARLVAIAQQLTRPRAANLGLDHVRGEFFCWLDDDDTYTPKHIDTLLADAARHSEALAVYGQAVIFANGEPTTARLGQAFNRALMHYGPLFHPSAALFRRRAIALGCRFDERFELCEDRDFVAQAATHSDLVYVPSASLHYASDLGTSGTGGGANRDPDARPSTNHCCGRSGRGPASWKPSGPPRTAGAALPPTPQAGSIAPARASKTACPSIQGTPVRSMASRDWRSTHVTSRVPRPRSGRPWRSSSTVTSFA